MTPEIREYARQEILKAKLRVIKRVMEPVNPTEKNPFPDNSFHNWNERLVKEKNYEELVNQRFMGIITVDGPGVDSATVSLEVH